MEQMDQGQLSVADAMRRAERNAATDRRLKLKVLEGTEADGGIVWDETHPLIEGTVDAPRTRLHMLLQQIVADEMQALGVYQRAGMGRPLSEFSGLSHSPDIKPDNIGLTIDGKIDMIEILSPSQTIRGLERKLEEAMEQLPEGMRGEIRVIDPGDAL
jgi:hypothetical protein